MQLTDFTDYSLRTLMALNQTKKVTTLKTLSQTLKISRNNLIKVSNRLAKLGYVEAARGPHGGLKINDVAVSLPVGTIIENLEERFYLAECFGNKKIDCTYYPSCQLNLLLHDALDDFIKTLNKKTLSDITPRK